MATIPAPAAAQHQPLTTTREERGRAIAKLGGIRKLGARYIVPSQSANSNVPTYLVDVIEQTCTCADYELRRQPCKHYEACMFWLAAEGSVNEETGQVTEPKKKQSKQDWHAYNAAQTTERERVPQLLKSLCEGIDEPARAPGKSGRKPIPRREAIYAAVMKVYSLCSGRRAESDIRDCVERDQLSRPWHYNTLFRVMEDPATTEILTRLIEESAAPLAEIENLAGQFAQDSTGFSTVTYDRWFDQKHGKLRAQHGWVKLHIMVGTLTNVVTTAKVSPEADCPLLPELLAATAQRFTVKEVSADKAYLSKKNLEAIDKVGAVPFIPFKSNSVGMASKSFHWRKMWAHFSLKSEDFLARYHRRSNVEATIGAIKALAGGAVRSKLPVARANEVLAKVLLHNLTCIVHAIEEFGIEVDLAPKLTVVKP